MKKVYFKPPSSSGYLNNALFRINTEFNTYLNIDKDFKNLGVDFNTIDLDKNDNGDLYVYVDLPYPWELSSWVKLGRTPKEKNVLFILESPIVNPFNQLTFLHKFFKKIYTWDDTITSNSKYSKYSKFIVLQSNFGLRTKGKNFNQKKFLTFINNKKDIPLPFVLLSCYKSNLYKERIKSLEIFTKRLPKDFEFYGSGWDRPMQFSIKERFLGLKKYSTYKGKTKEDKISTLSNYKFCLCFENTEAPGYITEKIFDCFKARVVPIYLGAPNITEYIDKDTFIDFRKFSGYDDLLSYLQSITKKKYEAYIKSIEKFMEKPSTKNTWFKKNFINVVVDNIKQEGLN